MAVYNFDLVFVTRWTTSKLQRVGRKRDVSDIICMFRSEIIVRLPTLSGPKLNSWLTISTLHCKTYRLMHCREISAEFSILKQTVHVAVTVLYMVIVCGSFKFYCAICSLNVTCLFSKTEFCCERSSETNLKIEHALKLRKIDLHEYTQLHPTVWLACFRLSSDERTFFSNTSKFSLTYSDLRKLFDMILRS
jgi:hypothetical protein